MAAHALQGPRVQLWLLPRAADRLRDHCRTGAALLSPAERLRLERSASAAVARRFLLGRVLMRRALAAYLEVDPASLVIVLGPHGKPRLLEPARPDLVFNLSNSRSDWAFALARGDGLGVDLEPIDRSAAIETIACTFYSAPERRRLGRRNAHAATEALQLWTLKEAVVKAVGGTVWEAMRAVQLELDAGRIAWLAPPPAGDQACWSLALGRLRRDHWLALALKTPTPPAPDLTVSCRILDDGDGHRATLLEPLLTSATRSVISGQLSSRRGSVAPRQMNWTAR